MGQPTTILKDSGIEMIANHLKAIEGGNILEVAAGNGYFTKSLSEYLKDYTSILGTDCNQEDIIKANKNNKNNKIKFQFIKELKLPYNKEEFDTVCISNSLHHLENVDKVLEEMFSVLKIGGNFILQEMFCDGVQTLAQKNDIILHTLMGEIDRLKGLHHNGTFPKEKIMNHVFNLELREIDMYIASRKLNCIKCKNSALCDNPKNKIDSTLTYIDGLLENIPENYNLPYYKKKCDEIKEEIRKHGYANASVLFFIGKK